MKINHLNLTVTDVDGASKFLEKYFGLQFHDGDSKFMVLFDDNGMVLTLIFVSLSFGLGRLGVLKRR